MKALLHPAVLLVMLMAASCSVKEDRAACPCELLVHSDVPLVTEGSILVSVAQDGAVVRQGMMTRQEFESGSFSLMVPRGRSTVTFFSGITSMSTAEEHSLAIRKYCQCDEVYSFRADVMLDSDRCELVRRPHKNYANLFITLIGADDDSVRVRGNVSGYDLMDLDPSEGTFICTPEATDEQGRVLVRLPRQVDDGLLLELKDKAGTERLMPLGKMIEQTGYSFEDEDLLDITLTVDLTNATISLRVADWDAVEFGIFEFS